jgi:photosystem II stability/assembly factor-like uncharacterized protein
LRGWTLPAVAAASVIAVVATIVGLAQLRHSGRHTADPRPPTSGQRTPAPSSGATETGQAFATPEPSSGDVTSVGLAGGSPVPAFRVVDLTFISTDVGWALGNGTCLDGSDTNCPAVMHTADGGASWVSTPNPPNMPVEPACGSGPCVSHLRFANAQVGYAYGTGALFMTTDGGQTWDPKNQGGASSLEVANDTALRVTGDQLQFAPVGTDTWKPATLPAKAKATVKGDVVRALHDAYVAAGTGGLYASTNDGRTWTEQPNPCIEGAPDGIIDAMTVAADGSSVAVVCATTKTASQILRTSTNNGVSFEIASGLTVQNFGGPFAATDSNTLFRSSPGLLQRSADHGKPWTPVAADKTKGTAAYLGFENSMVGRWVTGDGSTIYTTTDGGQKWTARTFP